MMMSHVVRVLLALLLSAAVSQAIVFFNDDAPKPPLEAAHPPPLEKEMRRFLSGTLGSNMVLQRDQPAVIWGFSSPGATITTVLQKGDDPPYPPLTTTVDAQTSIWRQALPVQNASKIPHRIFITSTTGEAETLENVLFGDVYLCSGQSNMQYTVAGTTNGTEEAKKGNEYPHIRLFSVGQNTNSPDRALLDLNTIYQPWSVANEMSLYSVGGPYFQFGYFASVCWFFGKELSDYLKQQVPIGLVSSDWGGTMVELWMNGGGLFNAMINPYMVGPMALTGFTWYQGEANAKNQSTADSYATSFPTMIEQWRKGFQAPESYFGFIQLSTWCPADPEPVAMLRQAQMVALALPNVGYATNADHGSGCNIHPPDKQYPGKRLAKSAMAMVYGDSASAAACEHWKSPSYSKAAATVMVHMRDHDSPPRVSHVVTIDLADVSSKGLYVIDTPFNARSGNFSFSCGEKMPDNTCVWAAIKMAQAGWLNATVSIQVPDQVVLTVDADINGAVLSLDDMVLETSYGWGSVPMMTLYDAGTDLPVLPWKAKIVADDNKLVIAKDARSLRG